MENMIIDLLHKVSRFCPSRKCMICPVALMPPRWKRGDRVRIIHEPEKCGAVIVSRCGYCARVEFEDGQRIDVGCYYDHELEACE